jgi:hypothetical protein
MIVTYKGRLFDQDMDYLTKSCWRFHEGRLKSLMIVQPGISTADISIQLSAIQPKPHMSIHTLPTAAACFCKSTSLQMPGFFTEELTTYNDGDPIKFHRPYSGSC